MFLNQRLQRQKPEVSELSYPNGSPSRPMATVTCRPRMWVQCILEGQINEPTLDDAHSTESGQTEACILVEEILGIRL